MQWQERLTELAQRHRVPGAALAVLAGGEVVQAAAGLLNVETKVDTTTDSLFQIGSITKVYTATLIMQLVDDGRIDLDEPVIKIMDELRLADPRITTRHLLTHTSGIEGDHFVDTGRGDDAIAKYVATCADLPMSHPVGVTFSYCNTGFVIAGRMIEHLTGLPWHEALRTRLLEPLKLKHTTGFAEEAIRFRTAFGHDVERGNPPRLVSTWQLSPSAAPAGSTLCATAADLVTFASTYQTVLSAHSAAEMRVPQVTLPDPWTFGSHWGIGWMLFDWGGRQVIGHDGGTLGQSAFLRLVPDAGVAIALLTNGGNTHDLYEDLYRELLGELCGIQMPAPLTPPAEPVTADPARHVGTYERVGNRIDILEKDDGLTVRITVTGPLAELVDDPVSESALVPVAEDLFVTRLGGAESWTPVVFYELPDGTRCVHLGARATPKVHPG
jgi:CubicO group peptidase (beta-lactamase class C family)